MFEFFSKVSFRETKVVSRFDLVSFCETKVVSSSNLTKFGGIFSYDLVEYHHGFKIYCQKVFVNTTKTVQKINEYQVTKIKKYAGFLLKSNIGDIWVKSTAATVS